MYSFRMSFWIVPDSRSRSQPRSWATATYMASRIQAVGLIVIETLMASRSMPSNSSRMSSRTSTATPSRPTWCSGPSAPVAGPGRRPAPRPPRRAGPPRWPPAALRPEAVRRRCSHRSSRSGPVAPDELVHRGADDGRRRVLAEDLGHTELLEGRHVLVGHDPAGDEEPIADALLPHQVEDPGKERHVGPGQEAHADGVDVLL